MAERTLELRRRTSSSSTSRSRAMPDRRVAATTTTSPATTTSTSRTRSGCPRWARTFASSCAGASSRSTLSRTQLRAKHFNTALGQLWLVLNADPDGVRLLHARDGHPRRRPRHRVLRPPDGGAVPFQLFAGLGPGGGELDRRRRQADPEHGLPARPAAAVVGGRGFRRFLPTVPVSTGRSTSIAGAASAGRCCSPSPIVGLVVLMAAGFACIVAAAQVYFRDLSGFVPYMLRIWLYSTPILYTAAEATERGSGTRCGSTRWRR